MRRKIPAITALNVFETAARHESFSRAADELFLTESAVSRQITSLEDYLGVKLFTRSKQRVILNEAGRAYFSRVSSVLDQLERDTMSLMANRGAGQTLALAVIPTFALRWLIPRLSRFRQAHPDFSVNLAERPEPFLFQGSGFDAAIHFDHPAWAGVTKIPLFTEDLVVVVNPQYFDPATLRTPADLRKVPLLHKSNQGEAWKRWFELVGETNDNPMRGSRVDVYAMLIEAVRSGHGAALVPRLYIWDEVLRGELFIPFKETLRDEKRYCFVYPDFKRDSIEVQTFRTWLEQEVAEYSSDRSKAGAGTMPNTGPQSAPTRDQVLATRRGLTAVSAGTSRSQGK